MTFTNNIEVDECQQVWMYVIKQAIYDATFGTVKTQKPKPKKWNPSKATSMTTALDAHNARHWFTGNSKDFRLVCEWAGFDPDHVRQMVINVMTECNQYLPEKYHFKGGV